jgi:hypothetical protein
VDLVRQLLATPPNEFVAARNRTVKELRKDGRKEAATAVAELRRLSLPDWALNVVASEEPDAVGRFVDAADDVRAAQAAAIEGREGADVRTVLHELRERTAQVVGLARAVLERAGLTSATASTGELTSRLAEIAGNPTAGGHLRAGLLGAEDAGAVDVFAGLVALAPPPARRRPRRKPSAAPPADDREQAAARRALARAVAEAERRQATVSKALAAAEAAVDKAQAGVATTRRRLERAQAELVDAEGRLDDAERARDEAADAVTAAGAAVDAARDAADR